MIPISLTSKRVTLSDGSTVYPYEFRGETLLIRDNALNVLEVLALFGDETLDVNSKGAQIIDRIFVSPTDAYLACDYSTDTFGELIESVVWDVFGLDTTGKHVSEPLWDVDEDAARIRTSIRMAYGLSWDEIKTSMSWSEMLSLIYSLPFDTPLGQAMYYRNTANRPKAGKYNKDRQREFDRLHREYKLHRRKGSQDRVTANQHAMDDLALAMRKRR